MFIGRMNLALVCAFAATCVFLSNLQSQEGESRASCGLHAYFLTASSVFIPEPCLEQTPALAGPPTKKRQCVVGKDPFEPEAKCVLPKDATQAFSREGTLQKQTKGCSSEPGKDRLLRIFSRAIQTGPSCGDFICGCKIFSCVLSSLCNTKTRSIEFVVVLHHGWEDTRPEPSWSLISVFSRDSRGI